MSNFNFPNNPGNGPTPSFPPATQDSPPQSVSPFGHQILCCPKIEVTSLKRPSTDIAFVAERMMFFLGTFWAGKYPEPETALTTFDLLNSANFSGVIRLSEHTLGGIGRQAISIRWLAPYHPDHPKSSKSVPIENRGTGPEGKYVEISQYKVVNEIQTGRLIQTDITMEYGHCSNHKETIFLARWFEFGKDLAIHNGSHPVQQGVLGYPKPEDKPVTCGKCRVGAPAGEFRVNIYTGRERPSLCVACQGYRRHREPQRKSRAKRGGSHRGASGRAAAAGAAAQASAVGPALPVGPTLSASLAVPVGPVSAAGQLYSVDPVSSVDATSAPDPLSSLGTLATAGLSLLSDNQAEDNSMQLDNDSNADNLLPFDNNPFDNLSAGGNDSFCFDNEPDIANGLYFGNGVIFGDDTGFDNAQPVASEYSLRDFLRYVAQQEVDNGAVDNAQPARDSSAGEFGPLVNHSQDFNENNLDPELMRYYASADQDDDDHEDLYSAD